MEEQTGMATEPLTMEWAEARFIDLMSLWTRSYHDSMEGIYNLLFTKVATEKRIIKHQEIFSEMLDNSGALKDWAEGNFRLKRFPANYYELYEAHKIADKETVGCLLIRDFYAEMHDDKGYFTDAPDQRENFLEAAGRLRIIERSLDYAHRSIDSENSHVNQEMLQRFLALS